MYDISEVIEPSLWDVMSVDPAVPIDLATLRLIIRDQQRASRAFAYPWVRILSRTAVMAIVVGKRVLPVKFSAHATMDRMCLWFLRHFVSPDAVSLLIRHFVVETNLLNFCLRNAGLPGEVELRPTTLAELGDRAVIEHDLNVYRTLLALAGAGQLSRAARLDFGMLSVPDIDPEPRTRRLLRLDIQTALCLMNIPFAFCLTPDEYRRAVHSLRLDASLLTILADITGDSAFLGWRQPAVRVDTNVDVPAAVYEHALLCELAHARLRRNAGYGVNLGDGEVVRR
jgi:hypothetical protein